MFSRKAGLWLCAGLCLCVGFAQLAFGQKGRAGGGGASRAIVTILDTVPAGAAGVVSDGQGTYIDSQLQGGDPCVTAYVKADGFFQTQMDFSPDVGSGCNGILGMNSTNRFYELRFPPEHAACTDTRFNPSSSPSLPEINGVCVLVLLPSTDEPLIGIPKLFNASASQVRFRFKRNGSYWVVALRDVPVNSTADPRVNTVSYNMGTARLFNDDKGSSGGYQVGADIPNFAVDISVERVP